MPIHDWTRVDSGTFHDFHQGWTIELRRALNRGVLPSGYFAMIDQRVSGSEPGAVSTEAGAYARKANRIAVRHRLGRVVAIIEVVSPGNKDSAHAIRSFTAKAAEFLRNGIHLLVVDLLPPTPRDPRGIHGAIWSELTDEADPDPPEKPLTAAAYDAGDELTAYVEPLAVGDRLPDMPLFLEPEVYVPAPLEATYTASWDLLPAEIRGLVEPPG